MERKIAEVIKAPPVHMVGDGFRVMGYFQGGRDLSTKMSPFVLLDYGAEHNFPPTDNKRRGVGPHPHRGFETVTVAFKGAVAHRDSTGSGGVIGPGDVQWMTAGSGILHREYHEESYAKKGGPMQMAQIWVNLPKAHKMTPPRYQPIVADKIAVHTLPNGGGSVRVIAGEYSGTKGPAKTFTPINMYDVRLSARGHVDIPLRADHNAGILVMKGEVTINGSKVATNDFVLFENVGDRVSIAAAADAQLLVLSGEPIREPMVQYGPFVMNTLDEIHQAITDFNNGKMGHLVD